MRYIFYILLLSLSGTHYGQSGEGNSLSGTTILTASPRNMAATLQHGIHLDKMIKSECLGSEPENTLPTKINRIEIRNDSIVAIEFTINENCCYDFLGEIEVTEDNILNLVYHGYGGYCACNCCFGLTYELFLYKEDNEYDFSKIKSVMLNGMKSTETKISLIRK